MTDVLRYAAFTRDPSGGNPAGVVLGADLADEAGMLRTAAEVGYSETAFLAEREPGRYAVRYFSPLAEVPFCGHATIAAGVILGERDAPPDLTFETMSGEVGVTVSEVDGARAATLTSVPTWSADVDTSVLAEALEALHWTGGELDPAYPPRVAYAGAKHLVLVARDRDRLARLDYAFDALADVMRREDWTTLQLARPRGTPASTWDVRDPFPVGGVVEDPATGAAAAAFGGYLRDLGVVTPPARLTLHQGEDLGRPGRLLVDVGEDGRVRVTGHAVPVTG